MFWLPPDGKPFMRSYSLGQSTAHALKTRSGHLPDFWDCQKRVNTGLFLQLWCLKGQEQVG